MDKTNRSDATICVADKCDNKLDKHRIHLGYTTCLNCSEEQRYVAHTVFPHKTGGYVQSVSKSQQEDLKRLDRRSVGGERAAKGIFADKSWDRWLENYNNPKPKKVKRIQKTVTNVFIPLRQAFQKVIDEFDHRGYHSACELTQSLYSDDKISLIHKSKIMNELASLQMMTTKQRKLIRKLNERNNEKS